MKKPRKNYVENTIAITVFYDESYGASSYDLTLFVMTYNYNSQSA
jgi:hypothetical protein